MKFAPLAAILGILAGPIFISESAIAQQPDTGDSPIAAQYEPSHQRIGPTHSPSPAPITRLSGQVRSGDPYQPHDGVLPNGVLANPPGFP
jgi:hypothetical protein